MNEFNIKATYSITKNDKRCPWDDIYICKDTQLNSWISADQEWWFHGGKTKIDNYKTYRGISLKTLGCQCTYNKSGDLVDNEYMGIYEYGLSLKTLEYPVKYHTLWDVFPHNAYKEYFKSLVKEFSCLATFNRY